MLIHQTPPGSSVLTCKSLLDILTKKNVSTYLSWYLAKQIVLVLIINLIDLLGYIFASNNTVEVNGIPLLWFEPIILNWTQEQTQRQGEVKEMYCLGTVDDS